MAVHRTFTSLGNRLIDIGNGVRERATTVIRKAALAGDVAVVTGTPVDTGHLRVSWVVRIGEEPKLIENPEPIEPINQAAAAEIAIEEAREVINFWRVGAGDINISNPLDYAERIDEGGSAQAPQGMTDFGIRAITDSLSNARLLEVTRSRG